MTPFRRRFIGEYLIDLDGAKAYVRAGGKAKRADQAAYQILRIAEVQQVVAAEHAARSKRLAINADRVVAELARLGFSNIADFVTIGADGTPRTDLRRVTREQMAAVAELTVEEFIDGAGEAARPVRRVKLKLAPKAGPLVDLGRHLGIFRERQTPIEEIPDDELAAVIAQLRTAGGNSGPAGGGAGTA